MRVCIDPGHGGSDPGATFHGVLEKTIALHVGQLLKYRLQMSRYKVVMTRESDTMVPLSTRCSIANKAGVDLFVSLHMNADPDPDAPGMPEARGEEIWIYPHSHNAKVLAQLIGEQIVKTFPDEPWRGVRQEKFAVLSRTLMPACLVEMGFIDCSDTARSMTAPEVQRKMADAIARGLEGYNGSKNRLHSVA